MANKFAIWLANNGFTFDINLDTGTLNINADIYKSESRKIACEYVKPFTFV